MSNFSPLNLVEGVSKKDLEEELTREAEYQNAYKLFQEAMRLKQAGDLVAAYIQFYELAQLDVIMNHYGDEESLITGLQNGLDAAAQPDATNYLHQNVKNIRYLYFRNRGFLYFAILKADLDVQTLVDFENSKEDMGYTQASFKKELFYDMLDGFSICPIYQEPDESLLRVLDDLYAYLEMARLRRYNLEFAVSFCNESDDIASVLPVNEWAVRRLSALKENVTSSCDAALLEKLSFLAPYKEDLQSQCDDLLRRKPLTICLEANVTWPGVITSINQAIKQHQSRGSSDTAKQTSAFNFHLPPVTTQDVVEFTFRDIQEVEEKDLAVSEPAQELTSEASVVELSQPPQETNDKMDLDMNDAAKSIPKSDSIATTMRLSKRLNRDEYQPMEIDGILLTRHYFAETETFFHNLDERLKSIFNVESPILHDIIQPIVATGDEKIQPRYMSVFLQTLNEWKPKLYNPILLEKIEGHAASENLKDSDKKRLLDILMKFGNQVSDVEVINDEQYLLDDPKSIKDFLEELNGSKKHINESKIDILRYLSQSIADKSWEPELFDTVFEWYMTLEGQIFQQYSMTQFSSKTIGDLEFLLSIYEVIINYYINCKDIFDRSLDSVSPSHFKSIKGSHSLGLIEVLRVHNRITKWRVFLEKVFIDPDLQKYLKRSKISVLARFLWSTNFFIAADSHSWKEKRYVVAHLDELHNFIDYQEAQNLEVEFPNYVNIGRLSATSLRRRLSTSSILSIFSRILEHSGSGENNDTIFLLETILLGNNTRKEEAIEIHPEMSLVDSILNGHALFDQESLLSVKKFFDECPLDLKLSLWSMLFSYYRSHSHERYQAGFEQFLAFIISFLESPEFVTENTTDPVLLIQLISSYADYLTVLLENLKADNWALKDAPATPQIIANLTRIFELCYSFSLHEESALITGCKVSLESKSSTAFLFFKDLCVKSVTTLLIYSVNQIKSSDTVTEKDDHIADLIALVHYQLGIRRLCDASNGLFLTFAEDCLMELKNFPTAEVTQLMSCRLHYKIKVEGKFPHDHYTSKKAELNRFNAMKLAAFVLPMCFEENPLTHNIRSDLKQIVEDIYEIYGCPETESDPTITQNLNVFESFLESVTLGPRFVKEVFYGLSPIEFLPASRNNEIANCGLYYLQAVLMFNSYKMRKKSAQSRTVELERIIALLKFDLVYGSGRAESWILLGQAYGYVVEDDTIWTSDKLNIPERKVITAISQKKALACYMMGIAAVTKDTSADSAKKKAVIAVLMNSFVKEMYSATRPPMDMIAFKVYKTPKFTQKGGNKSYNHQSDSPAISNKFCLKLMQRCLEIALKADPSDWTTFYYLGKVRSKLSFKPEIVLETICRANDLAKSSSNASDPILEPAYKYYSLVYKYVKYDSISVSDGLRFLEEEPFLAMKSDVSNLEKRQFYLQVAACLTRLSSLDKKLWYHKPSYRLATIVFEELNDSAWARRAISRFFTLKANNKMFLQMWKPEHERPGKHFVYMYQYTQFFLSILEQDKDLTSLMLLFPKLRRANSSMVQLYSAWERMCSITCQLVREVARIESVLVERFLYMTSYTTFIHQAKMIIEYIQSASLSADTEMYLRFLYELMELRKLNNGYGPTSLIDDTFAGLFIKIYNECVAKADLTGNQPASPTGKSKRLAKKDLFPFAVDLAGKQKRAVDSHFKQTPDFFNEYVSQFLIDEVARSQRRLYKTQRQWATFFVTQQTKAANKKMILSTVPGAHAPDFFVSTHYNPAIATAVGSIPARLTTRLDGLSSTHSKQLYEKLWQPPHTVSQAPIMAGQQYVNSQMNQVVAGSAAFGTAQNPQSQMATQYGNDIPSNSINPSYQAISAGANSQRVGVPTTDQSSISSTLPVSVHSPSTQGISRANSFSTSAQSNATNYAQGVKTPVDASGSVSASAAVQSPMTPYSSASSFAQTSSKHTNYVVPNAQPSALSTGYSNSVAPNVSPFHSQASTFPPSGTPIHSASGASHDLVPNGNHPKCEICERNYAIKNKLPYFKVNPADVARGVSAGNVYSQANVASVKKNVRGSPVEDVFHNPGSLQNMNQSAKGSQPARKKAKTNNAAKKENSARVSTSRQKSVSDQEKPLTRRQADLLLQKRLNEEKMKPEEAITIDDDGTQASSRLESPGSEN